MATAKTQVHKSRRHADPFKTRTGKDRLKALSVKKLYELLNKGIEHFSNIDSEYTFMGGSSNYENNFKYSENKRLNLNFGMYPPCFNLSYEAQQIFEILGMKGQKRNFEKLFDVYSILLCQKYHAGYKECNPIMLKERIDDVQKMIPSNFDQVKYRTRISKYIKLNNSKVSKLIFLCFYIIEQEMKKINDEQIISLNRNFYFSTFKELFTLCDKY